MRASFVYHQITAAISIISTFAFFYYLFKPIDKDPYQIILLLLLLSISWGIHGLIHFWEEVFFDFNPLDGRHKVYDTPQIKKYIY